MVLWLADVVPGTGEVFRYQGLRITVRAADERRIRELSVETEAPA
ncbi:MAG: transporter associated domain-containing protein [Verrucomicrobiota bacterium]